MCHKREGYVIKGNGVSKRKGVLQKGGVCYKREGCVLKGRGLF